MASPSPSPSTQSSTFVTLDNLKQCEDRFRTYMAANHGLHFDTPDESAFLRRLLYATMQDVRRMPSPASGPASLRGLNNELLNRAREAVLSRRATKQANARQYPQGQHGGDASARGPPASGSGLEQTNDSLSRDRDVYGSRDVLVNRLLPGSGDAGNAGQRRSDTVPDLTRDYERALDDLRKAAGPTTALVAGGGRGVVGAAAAATAGETVDPMDASEFDRRMSDLLSARNEHQVRTAQEEIGGRGGEGGDERDVYGGGGGSRGDAQGDGTALLEGVEGFGLLLPAAKTNAAAVAASASDAAAAAAAAAPDADGGKARRKEKDSRGGPWGSPLLTLARPPTLLPPPPKTRTEVRYLALSGCDRDYESNPLRFRFTARTGGRQDSNSLTGSYGNIAWIEATRVVMPMDVVQAGTLVNVPAARMSGFSFAFPYAMLHLEGFDGVYDATNETMRRAFSLMVFDNEYKTPSGRGYIMLRPAQEERRAFATPLSGLRDLTVSLLKPNGTLFNNRTDSYTASALQYEPSSRLLLKVVVDQYFERSELFVGDSVLITGMRLEPNGAAPADQQVPQGYIASLAEFVGRRQGHEVVQLGQANEQGFYKSFYVLAPGMLDQANGRVTLDDNMIAVVNAMGAGAGDPAAAVQVAAPGRVLNMSLQMLVTLRMGCLSGDGLPKPEIVAPA